MEIDGRVVPPRVTRVFVTSGSGESGMLELHTQYLAGDRVFVAVGGHTFTGETIEMATDKAYYQASLRPWMRTLMAPGTAAQMPAAVLRYRQRAGIL
jgi:hypothetical protein